MRPWSWGPGCGMPAKLADVWLMIYVWHCILFVWRGWMGLGLTLPPRVLCPTLFWTSWGWSGSTTLRWALPPWSHPLSLSVCLFPFTLLSSCISDVGLLLFQIIVMACREFEMGRVKALSHSIILRALPILAPMLTIHYWESLLDWHTTYKTLFMTHSLFVWDTL